TSSRESCAGRRRRSRCSSGRAVPCVTSTDRRSSTPRKSSDGHSRRGRRRPNCARNSRRPEQPSGAPPPAVRRPEQHLSVTPPAAPPARATLKRDPACYPRQDQIWPGGRGAAYHQATHRPEPAEMGKASIRASWYLLVLLLAAGLVGCG